MLAAHAPHHHLLPQQRQQLALQELVAAAVHLAAAAAAMRLLTWLPWPLGKEVETAVSVAGEMATVHSCNAAVAAAVMHLLLLFLLLMWQVEVPAPAAAVVVVMDVLQPAAAAAHQGAAVPVLHQLPGCQQHQALQLQLLAALPAAHAATPAPGRCSVLQLTRE
jgi:hypothetical protein